MPRRATWRNNPWSNYTVGPTGALYNRGRSPRTAKRMARYTRKRSYGKRKRTYTARRKTSRVGYRRREPRCFCRSGEISSGQRFLLAQADPFDPRALGGKIPDSSTQPSIPIACQELHTPLMAINDVNCVAYLPAVTNSIVTGVPAAGLWAWPINFGGTANWVKRADVVTAVEVARPVAHGIRLSSSVAPTAATGYVHIAIAVEAINGVTSWQWPTTVAGLSGYTWYKRITLASLTQTPITIINKYVDETAFRYLAQDGAPGASGSANTFHVPLSWGALLVCCEGPPSASPVQVEMLLHLEAIPKNTGVLSGSSAAATSPGLLAGAAALGARTDFAHTEDQQVSHVAQALNNAAAGMADAGNSAFNNVVMPLARNAGYSVANAAMGAAISGVAGIMGVNSNPGRLALN